MKNKLKKCLMCETEKQKTEFTKCSKSPDELYSYCKTCTKEYKKKKNYKYNYPRKENEIPYRITHPEKWKAYSREYMLKYRESPLNKARLNFGRRLLTYINKGIIIKPKKIECAICKTPTIKPVAKYNLKLLNKSINAIIKKVEFIKKIIWVCNRCKRK